MASSEGSGFNIPRNNSSPMEDSDSDYEKENIRPRGLTGLQNLGNTCYLNSALQSLSNCPPLTQYFLDCESLIRPEKSPMLSRSYLKLITELWHKKRPSYVVPSGIVSGIKAVHPMFRGFTQQDAQEFLRCLMDQLHEELKSPVLLSDDSDDDDQDDDIGQHNGECPEDNANNTNNARPQVDVIDNSSSVVVGGRNMPEQKSQSAEVMNRRPSFDSTSSQSELDYETCDSGLSSERSSNAGRDVGSSDEIGSDFNVEGVPKIQQETKRSRKSSALSLGSGAEEYYTPALDMVANTKEMKETANLLEKETEKRKGKVYMESGDSKEQGGAAAASAIVVPEVSTASRDGDAQAETKPKPVPIVPIRKPRKPQNFRYDSIISQTFDGKILSSVRCLNCETVSTTKETFQDLSLPIPSKDHLHMLHSGYPSATGGGVSPPKGGACGEVNQGWLASVLTWMKSWFVGPTVTLQDCLAAFFSADELKGDNMYSCGKCKKLRNGLKYSKVLDLPEILSIHLKRFRHEFYSSKISTYISFPLEGLDMDPYADKDCRNEVTTYDLVAIICHHGTAGGGHYTAYCLNHLNGQWYEFDDQYVTEVDVSQVQNCEAYVLFYRKSNKKIDPVRQKILEMETDERASILKFYISRQWLSRFQTFAEPGPITNMDFLCKHGGVPPGKIPLMDHLIAEIPQDAWEILYNRFGGGMVCNHLFACKVCEDELERLNQRQRSEKETFIQLNEDFQDDEYTGPVYAISMAWFREWECFVTEKTDAPPEAIDNSRIVVNRNGQPTLRQNSDQGHLSKEMWLFLHRIYGGGPELLFRQSTGAVKKTSNTTSSVSPPHAQTTQQQLHHLPQQNKPTLASLAAAASASTPSSSSSSAYPQMASSMSSSASPGPSTISSTPTTVSSLPSTASIAEGAAPHPTSQVVTPNGHNGTSSPSKSAPVQLRADNLEATHSSAPVKMESKQHQKDSISNGTEAGKNSPQRSPTKSGTGRPPNQPSVDDGVHQSLHAVSSSESNKPYTECKKQSTTPSLPAANQVSAQTLGKSDVNSEDNTDNNVQKLSPSSTAEILMPTICESQDDSVSCSSLNELSSSSAAQDETKSICSTTSTVVSDGSHISKRLSHISQDSGISSEASPSVEDQNCVVGNNAVETDSVGKRSSDEVGKYSPKTNDVSSSINGSKGSTPEAVGFGGVKKKDNKSGDGHDVNRGGSGVAEKPTGGRGRNKKKKNKAMEVTRI